ncbi:serine hydrolase domain-containing protein [Flavobacterium aquidurense]|uniref:Beta-lactamase n=1 Tax=Flavobacterium aquidurense TaxID=362413 RepID=A0A0Q0S853_9FLAO|nr:serine hydrolase [Flavobacterium aquidurense]KQB39833.1 Beta-lactamase [Flavobacterium aquidurense]
MKDFLFVYILLVLNIFTITGQVHQTQYRSALDQMTDSILSNHYPKIHSVLIAKNNQLIYEHYFNGYTKDSLNDSRSSFKSITSLLVGIAIDKGFIKDINQKVYEFFPEYPSLKTDPLKKLLTIKNLLEMKSGFDCEEFNDTKDCEDNMSQSKNWVEYSLNLPMKNKPGEVWAYTSVNPMILSGIIKKATNMSVKDFAKKYLFDPLNISSYKWTVDPSGNAMTAGSFYMLPIDMLKISQLVKDKGVYNHKQIISKKWIAQSTVCNIMIPDFSFMKSSRSKIGFPQPAYYGYYWYRETIKTNNIEENLLFASGNGGQYIFIIERLNLTVVFTQGNYGSFKAKQAFEILAKYILQNSKD